MNPVFIGEVVEMLACEIEQLFVDGMAKFGRESEKAAGFLGVHFREFDCRCEGQGDGL